MYFSWANGLKIVLLTIYKLCLSMSLLQSYNKCSLNLFNINLAVEININKNFWIN